MTESNKGDEKLYASCVHISYYHFLVTKLL